MFSSTLPRQFEHCLTHKHIISHIPPKQRTSVPCCFFGDFGETAGACVNHGNHILGYSLNVTTLKKKKQRKGWDSYWSELLTHMHATGDTNHQFRNLRGGRSLRWCRKQSSIFKLTTNRKQTESATKSVTKSVGCKDRAMVECGPPADSGFGEHSHSSFPLAVCLKLGPCGADTVKVWTHCIFL